MKLSDLKDWNKLTPAEQERLRKVYGEDAEITKTMAQKPPAETQAPSMEVLDITKGGDNA